MGKGKSGMGASSNKAPVPGSYTSNADTLTRSRSDYVGDANVEMQVDDYLNHHLEENEESRSVDSFEIIQNPTNSGMADVDVNYSSDIRIPFTDNETGETYYEYDTEYHTTTLQLKVLSK